MEEKMHAEFDVIELKVKRYMKVLAESKDKEIDAALARALEAERILSELNAAVLPVISSAEDTGEK
jgi:predicted methyltransferase MtxX (methanogen marker protein 4)